MSSKSNDQDDNIITFGHFDIGDRDDKLIIDNVALPIIATRNLVLFPNVVIPIHLVRPGSLELAREAQKKNLAVGIVCQKDPDEENPLLSDLYNVGVYGEILQIVELPDESHTAVIRGLGKFRIEGEGDICRILSSDLVAEVKPVRDVNPRSTDKDFPIIVEAIHDLMQKMHNTMGENSPVEMIMKMSAQAQNPADMINIIATHSPCPIDARVRMLATSSIKKRAIALYEEMVKEQEKMGIIESLGRQARRQFDEQQRRMFLQRQLEAIEMELNGDESDAGRLRQRAAEVNLPEHVAKIFDKEVDKLSRYGQQSPEYGVQLNYLETLLDLPWSVYSKPSTEFVDVSTRLDADHYGLEKVKERILEQLAVVLHNPDGNSPILCLVGPPGVGKTSLGRSIANSLGLKFARVSLGGLHDEAEIRGHRRTYIGAMPGRIVDAIRRAGAMNPVLVLDEVDKIGNDYKGDPASALLEVLDPEQNCHFHDNYIDIDIDLSKVMFIVTANSLDTVSRPLLDRMEIIDLQGYITEEKMEIARRHILPRLADQFKIAPERMPAFTDAALQCIIGDYTAESGVRQLEKSLASILRKLIKRHLQGKSIPEIIDAPQIEPLLGVRRYCPERYEAPDTPGVTTGLAWTAAGGEILFIETSLSQSKESRLTLTGNLGDVMKESATIALQYVKANAADLGIPPEAFDTNSVHIHVPEGAIPKDGPSAGITMATSIASAFTGRKALPGIAMTGELTLRGKVLPVGGIKEKILAAKRAGISTIILSAENRKDVEDIAEIYRRGLTFIYVRHVSEVFAAALA